MINSVEFDLKAFEDSQAEVEKVIKKLDQGPARKALIDAANEGLIVALRKHFALREKELPKSSGFPYFGQHYPKKYFWRGTRGTSVSEQIRVTFASPSRLVGQVSINSPALAHKLASNPPDIKPKGGNRYLAIPANPIAASWDGMPRDFPGGLRLAFSKTPDGHWLPSLVAASNYKKRSKKTGSESKSFGKSANAGRNEVVYWLVHKAKSRHDPNAMPTQQTQTTAATSAVRTAVKRILAR